MVAIVALVRDRGIATAPGDCYGDCTSVGKNLVLRFMLHPAGGSHSPSCLLADLLLQRLPWPVSTQIALSGVYERLAGSAHPEKAGNRGPFCELCALGVTGNVDLLGI
jgi:hypothetical protein